MTILPLKSAAAEKTVLAPRDTLPQRKITDKSICSHQNCQTVPGLICRRNPTACAPVTLKQSDIVHNEAKLSSLYILIIQY